MRTTKVYVVSFWDLDKGYYKVLKVFTDPSEAGMFAVSVRGKGVRKVDCVEVE